MHHSDNDNRPIAVASKAAAKNGARFLSVCSGIEAASQAWPQWQAVAFSEIEKFPSAVLAHHYPEVPNLGDFTQIDTATLGRVDILCGGTPCQAFSVAGKREGLADARGNLTLKFVELAHELADGNGLRNVVWENVVGVLSDKTNAFGCFLAGLVGADAQLVPPNAVWGAMCHFDGESYDVHRTYGWKQCTWPCQGMVSGPKGRASWTVKDGQFFGVAQRRRRVIVVADFGNGADPAAVLFEPEGVRRDTPPSREEGEKPAPTISARTKGGGGLGTDFDLDGGLVKWPADVCPTLDTYYGDKMGLEDQHVFNQKGGKFVRGDLPVAFQSKASAQQSVNPSDVAPTLDKSKSDGISVLTVALRGREGGATAELGGEVATALRASQGGGDKPHVLAQAYSIMPMNSGKDYKARPTDIAQPIMAGGPVGAIKAVITSCNPPSAALPQSNASA